jgi:hypothetical protein
MAGKQRVSGFPRSRESGAGTDAGNGRGQPSKALRQDVNRLQSRRAGTVVRSQRSRPWRAGSLIGVAGAGRRRSKQPTVPEHLANGGLGCATLAADDVDAQPSEYPDGPVGPACGFAFGRRVDDAELSQDDSSFGRAGTVAAWPRGELGWAGLGEAAPDRGCGCGPALGMSRGWVWGCPRCAALSGR